MSAEPIPLPRKAPAHGWALLAVLRAPAADRLDVLLQSLLAELQLRYR
mgnify:CR=1 FL=1